MPNYTSNLNLTKPLGTDLYDVDVFNDNMDKVDAALGDYIVEQGVVDASYVGEFANSAIAGSWMYRKWNSGLVECWTKLSRAGDFTSTWGSLYETKPFPRAVYPVTFVELPMEYATSGNNTIGAWVEVSGQAQQTLTATNSYQLIRPAKDTTKNVLTINLYVIGKWK